MAKHGFTKRPAAVIHTTLKHGRSEARVIVKIIRAHGLLKECLPMLAMLVGTPEVLALRARIEKELGHGRP